MSTSFNLHDTSKSNATEWELAYRDYTQGCINLKGQYAFPTLRDVGKKYGLKEGQVLTRAGREKWNDSKEIFIKERREAIDKSRVESYVANSQVVDQKAISDSIALMNKINQRLTQEGVTIGDATKASDTNVSSAEGKNLYSIYTDCVKNIRLILGQPTDIKTTNGDINGEIRRNIEQLRLLDARSRQPKLHGSTDSATRTEVVTEGETKSEDTDRDTGEA